VFKSLTATVVGDTSHKFVLTFRPIFAAPLVPYQNVKIQKPERAVKASRGLCTELALPSLVGSSSSGGGNSAAAAAAANPPPRMSCSLCADDGSYFHTRNIALCAA
jgi:hypothetical protein